MKLKSLLVGIVLIGVFLGCAKYLLSSDVFDITTISWEHPEGPYKEYYKSLQYQLDEKTEGLKGQAIWNISIYDLENNLKSLSWIEAVHVHRQLPNKLIIRLEHKKILANIMKNNSELQPIASDSTLLEPAKISKSPAVPFLSNEEFRKNENLRFEVVTILSKLPEFGPLSQDSVSEVHWDGKKEFTFLLRESLAKIKLSSENTEIKIARVSKVLNYLDQNQIKSRVIDANFSKKVVVKLRNHD